MENQQIPTDSSSLDNFFNIAFDESTRAQVRKAAQWARIGVLCTFIGYGVSLIVAFFGKQTHMTMTEEGERVSSYTSAGSIFGVLITVGVGIWINYYLYRFATETAKGMDAMDSMKTNEGFNNLRTYFKVLGILLIIAFCIAGLFLLLALFQSM